MRFLASAKDVKGGIAGVVGREAGLFEDLLASSEQRNDFVMRSGIQGGPRRHPGFSTRWAYLYLIRLKRRRARPA